MREHLQALEVAARRLMPGEPCHESECEDCVDDRALLDAITSALAEAERVDADYQRAKAALARWDSGFRAESPAGSNMDVVRAYFNLKGGE